MKTIYSIFATLLLSVLMVACQSDDVVSSNEGYLRLNVETITASGTRIADEYNAKQLAVQIINNSNGLVAEETDDHTEWATRTIRLQPGSYTIKASSNGFDGSESGFDIPYYTGETEVTIATNEVKTAKIECTLANVKVTVNFDDNFKAAFSSAVATVSSALQGVAAQQFIMNQTDKSAYYPVGELSSVVTVVNKRGEVHTSDPYKIGDVKARDHYILNYKVAEAGTVGDVEIRVDGTETVYNFYFPVSTEARLGISVTDVNAWSKFAYVTGIVTALKQGSELDNSKMTFEYKAESATDWISVTPTSEGTGADAVFKATLPSLEPNTTYECRMSYTNGTESSVSSVRKLTTDVVVDLVNGNFDDWYQSGKTWYPASESYFNANGGSFWDSSNPGTTTGAGAIVNINPTQGNSSVVHTAGGKSACLTSHWVSVFGITKFAAASVYTGAFKGLQGTAGAELYFGQPFTGRPTQLTGWYNYTPANINHRGEDTPDGLGVEGTPDLCSVYIALMTERILVDNTDMSTFPDWNNDERVVAYGAMSDAEAVATNGWKQFTIDLKYANTTTKPEYILVLSSSSKYGDYFTGGEGSVLYLDDFELKYDKEPTVK